VINIGQIAITVSDVEKALTFYRDILGLPFLFQPSPTLAFLRAGVDTNAPRIMLSTPQGAGEVGKNSVLYFKVVAIEAEYQSALNLGAEPERPAQLAAKMPDHELWLAFVRDPDGNLVGMMEERPFAA
jgi:catechol 2,3-dioxygenase-like lactoylglutathione lyase family enzyme